MSGPDSKYESRSQQWVLSVVSRLAGLISPKQTNSSPEFVMSTSEHPDPGAIPRCLATERLRQVIEDPRPSEELVRAVRAGFVLDGTSFEKWCTRNSIKATAARMALLGAWNGPKGKRMRKRIIQAAGLEPRA